MMGAADAAAAEAAGTGGTPPGERLATAFAQHVLRWAREQGAAPAAQRLVARAARCVSRATSDGHSCIGLDELIDPGDAPGVDEAGIDAPSDRTTLGTLLLASKVVGTPDAPAAMPLIVDDERLYLHRYFDYECRLAASLAARRMPRSGDPDAVTLPDTVVALLDRLFTADARHDDARQSPVPQTVAPDWQKIAAITALLGRLTIISGGPGTGKTTTVVNLLACLLEADPDCRIALTAPTGKAASRMTEVIQQRAGHLPDALRAKLPTSSSTIHRLLGAMPHGEFRHHAGNELPIDVLVVDEASMLDLALAVHLIEAVPMDARIILLGDKDQLAAVESGAVFAELGARPTFSARRVEVLSRLAKVPAAALQSPAPGFSPPGSSPPGSPAPGFSPPGSSPPGSSPPGLPQPIPATGAGLDDSVIWLRRNYRFASASGIGLLATDINDGSAARVLERLERRSDPSLFWHADGGRVPSDRTTHEMLEGYAPYVHALRTQVDDPRTITDAFARFRVLCALREGPWGINAINREISMHVRRMLQHPQDPGLRSEWYPGRPVMVLRNDPVLKLFNGDIGIALPDASAAVQVWFPDETGGFRPIAPVRLPDHETAYAMTVHKSQGSEFESVLLVLPAENSRVLTRELLYTAVTRARERLGIVANANILTGTIGTATRRLSGLSARLPQQSTTPPARSTIRN